MFVATPLIGHLFPMMPLALRLHALGHRVLVATGGDAVTAVAGDIAVADVAPDIGFVRTAVLGLGPHPVAALRCARGMADARGGARFFAPTAKAMLPRLDRLAAEFAPDLVVHEPFAAEAALVAAHAGVPAVLHNIALDDGTVMRREMLRVLGAAAAPPLATLSIAPPSVVAVPGRALRYTPYATSGAETPDFLRVPPDRPRILVTRSTMLGDGPDAMLRSVLRAANGVDADIVIVRPNRKTARAKALPANVRTVGWVRPDEVLPTCTAMVNHGGAGSIYAALWAGIPQLATPAPGDRRWNALTVQRRGAGVAVAARRITATDLNRLVTDVDMHEAAHAVATEIAAMPSATATAKRLVALADHEQ
ncbi:glycosyltransferase [Nocardia transvalensis]|nr:glycosyltransferase [Nocardia transvalensis]